MGINEKVYDIKNYSMRQKIKVSGCNREIEIDFSDRRRMNKILHLMKFYRDLEVMAKEIDEKAAKIEDLLERRIFIDDEEMKILEKLKSDVDDAFGAGITEALFGDCVPEVYRYYSLFEAVSPVIAEYSEARLKAIASVSEKYSLERLSKEG